MAVGRMFTQSFVQRDKFQELTPTERCCYFELCLFTDDEGYLDGLKTKLNQFGYDSEILDTLEEHGFIYQLQNRDGEKVVLFKHFFENNTNLYSFDNSNFNHSKYNYLSDGFDLKRKGKSKKNGDGIYYKKTPIEAGKQSKQEIENASIGDENANELSHQSFKKESSNVYNDSNISPSQEQERAFEAVYNACPENYRGNDKQATYEAYKKALKGIEDGEYLLTGVKNYYNKDINNFISLPLDGLLNNQLLLVDFIFKKGTD